MVWVLCSLFESNPGCCSCAVVTISYVSKRHFFSKQFFQLFIGFSVFNHPEMMTKTILGNKIIISLFVFHDLIDNFINFRNSPVGKKYRFYICIQVAG